MPCPLASKLAGELAPRAQSNTEATTKEPAVPADKLHITLAGREHVVEAGTTAGDALASLANIRAAGGAEGGRGGGGGGSAPSRPPRGAGRARRGSPDHLRQPRPGDRTSALEGSVPRPASAEHQAHPCVQAHAQRRRLLARQRAEPPATADLRHRLAVARSAGRVPENAR